MPWRPLLALAGASAALLVLSSPVEAASPVGRPWPGGTITYYNDAADQAWPVARAVYVWNHSGARVRFVPSSRAEAQLLITHFAHNRCVDHARATVGFVPRATVWLPRTDEASGVCNSYSSALAVTHELGHVLGLGHENRGCALMNSSSTWRGPRSCAQVEPWKWRCRLLEEDDVRGAVSLYGGSVNAIRDPFCPAYEATRPPAWLDLQPSEGGGVQLRFPRPAVAYLPPFLSSYASGEGGYAFVVSQGRCSSDVSRARRYRWSVAPLAQTRIVDRSASTGRYCYTMWALDRLNRPSDRFVTAWVTLS